MNKKECIYIAGPECFYPDGFTALDAMRRYAEYNGFDVSLPNDTTLKLDHEDLRLNADAIFENCRVSMNRSTVIIADLEFYRGPEPDGGTIYELGMAYARGIRCYGYTRDKRSMVWKYQHAALRGGEVYDLKGRVLPYNDLPFSPDVIGSTKIVEGDFRDCLRALMTDLEEERKLGPRPPAPQARTMGPLEKPIVYLAGPERYDARQETLYAHMKLLCAQRGLIALTPADAAFGIAPSENDDPYAHAYAALQNDQQHVRNCDAVIANLNDFHGWEPESDTSFACGMAFQLGKKLYGYMDDTSIMKKRVPSLGEEYGWRDACGCNVENFDYPINLMFASSMKLFEGNFEGIVDRVAAELMQPH